MDNSGIFEELVVILEENGVRVRREAMGGGGGGMCLIDDERVCFVDTEAAVVNNAVNCAEAVNKIVDIEMIYIRPVVREFLEKHQHQAIDTE